MPVQNRPEDLRPGERRAGVIFCNGFHGYKEAVIPPVVQGLTQAGYVCLTFDYRWCGDSEGEPRWQVLHEERLKDIQNAITYLRTRAEVDPGKIGLYGSSMGGGYVTYLAATDDRVGCVVSNVGVTNGRRWQRALRREYEWYQLLEEIEEDRKRRVLHNETRYIHAWEAMPVAQHERDAHEELYHRYTKNGKPCEMTQEITMSSMESTLAFDAEAVAHKIRAPILWVALRRDAFTPAEESIGPYEKAPEPKRLVMVGDTHFDVYGHEAVNQFREVRTWYETHLPPRS